MVLCSLMSVRGGEKARATPLSCPHVLFSAAAFEYWSTIQAKPVCMCVFE